MIIDFKAHVMPGMDKVCKNRIDTIRRLMAHVKQKAIVAEAELREILLVRSCNDN